MQCSAVQSPFFSFFLSFLPSLLFFSLLNFFLHVGDGRKSQTAAPVTTTSQLQLQLQCDVCMGQLHWRRRRPTIRVARTKLSGSNDLFLSFFLSFFLSIFFPLFLFSCVRCVRLKIRRRRRRRRRLRPFPFCLWKLAMDQDFGVRLRPATWGTFGGRTRSRKSGIRPTTTTIESSKLQKRKLVIEAVWKVS